MKWKLPEPSLTVENTFDKCIEKVRKKEFKKRLVGVREEIISASIAFEEAIQKDLVHTISPVEKLEGTAGIVTKDEMMSIYKNRFADSNANARPLYNELISVTSRCPLCGHRDVSTLDHYLPKAQFISLSVTPSNLVPACGECNFDKSEERPDKPYERLIHPYFDNLDSDEIWLLAKVLPTKPATLEFSVDPPISWPVSLRRRLIFHFETMKLGKLYRLQACTVIAGKRVKLRNCEKRGSTESVRQELQEEAESWEAVNRNCWQAATYRALALNEWYCGGGYNEGF